MRQREVPGGKPFQQGGRHSRPECDWRTAGRQSHPERRSQVLPDRIVGRQERPLALLVREHDTGDPPCPGHDPEEIGTLPAIEDGLRQCDLQRHDRPSASRARQAHQKHQLGQPQTGGDGPFGLGELDRHRRAAARGGHTKGHRSGQRLEARQPLQGDQQCRAAQRRECRRIEGFHRDGLPDQKRQAGTVSHPLESVPELEVLGGRDRGGSPDEQIWRQTGHPQDLLGPQPHVSQQPPPPRLHDVTRLHGHRDGSRPVSIICWNMSCTDTSRGR